MCSCIWQCFYTMTKEPDMDMKCLHLQTLYWMVPMISFTSGMINTTTQEELCWICIFPNYLVILPAVRPRSRQKPIFLWQVERGIENWQEEGTGWRSQCNLSIVSHLISEQCTEGDAAVAFFCFVSYGVRGKVNGKSS